MVGYPQNMTISDDEHVGPKTFFGRSSHSFRQRNKRGQKQKEVYAMRGGRLGFLGHADGKRRDQ